MITLLFALMLLSGIILIGSILLMAPKGGLGFGVGGMNTSNEYGSKKSLEGTLKKSAIFSVLVFTICAIVYPYIAKKELSTGAYQKQVKQATQQIKLNPEDIKINGVDSKDIKIDATKSNTKVENNGSVNTTVSKEK